jgi:hypothetical protein
LRVCFFGMRAGFHDRAGASRVLCSCMHEQRSNATAGWVGEYLSDRRLRYRAGLRPIQQPGKGYRSLKAAEGPKVQIGSVVGLRGNQGPEISPGPAPR